MPEYIVQKGVLVHSGKEYKTGEVVRLTEDEAKAVGAVVKAAKEEKK